MVNPTVFEYFRKNRGKYPISALKDKALKAGYSERDVNDAIVMSGGAEDSKKPPIDGASSGFGWMGLAGIFGMFFFLLYLGLITSGVYFGVDIVDLFEIWWVMIISILSCIYLYGFVRLGGYTNSKLVRFSSYSRILFALGFVGIYYIVRPSLINKNLGLSGIFIGVVFAYIVLVIVVKYLFAVGLVRIGDRIRFLKIVGVLNLVYISLISLGFIYVAYLFFTAGSLRLDLSSMNLLYWDFVVIEVFNISSLFFESIALFFAHKKFE